MISQAYLLFIFILCGFLISVLFDIFRVIRKSFKTTNNLTYLEDTLFWLFAGSIVLYTIFKFSDGELRGFQFLGITIRDNNIYVGI